MLRPAQKRAIAISHAERPPILRRFGDLRIILVGLLIGLGGGLVGYGVVGTDVPQSSDRSTDGGFGRTMPQQCSLKKPAADPVPQESRRGSLLPTQRYVRCHIESFSTPLSPGPNFSIGYDSPVEIGYAGEPVRKLPS
jgi:hypothetical protein